MADKLTVVHYAINGTGGGHITRQTNIAREERALLRALNIPHDIIMLTTSDASHIANGFLTYKLPSKTSIPEDDRRSYVARSHVFVTNIAGSVQPDILVMDTAPNGSFGDVGMWRNMSRRMVFVNRHRDEDQQADPGYQLVMEQFYDLILTPDVESERERYTLSVANDKKNHFVNCIHGVRPEAMLTRAEARHQFDIDSDEHLVYISAGAGGDPNVERDLDVLIDTLLAEPRVRLLVGYGPLYKGTVRFHRRMISYQDVGVSRFFRGVDFAFSAAGYNTYQELLAAGVPAAFFAQAKKMDRQDERVRLGDERGWNLTLKEVTPDAIRMMVLSLMTDKTVLGIKAKLEERSAEIGAGQGAVTAAYRVLDMMTRGTNVMVPGDKLKIVYVLRLLWSETCQRHGFTDVNAEKFTCVARLVLAMQSYPHHPSDPNPSEESRAFLRAFSEGRQDEKAHERLTMIVDQAVKLMQFAAEKKLVNGQLFDLMRDVLRRESDLSLLEARVRANVAAVSG